jgi:hypothetical protein
MKLPVGSVPGFQGSIDNQMVVNLTIDGDVKILIHNNHVLQQVRYLLSWLYTVPRVSRNGIANPTFCPKNISH